MVKGISRQVIVVQSPDKKLFDQAIFILRDDVVGNHTVTEENLLREARYLLHSRKPQKRLNQAVWTLFGAAVVALVWLLSALL